MTARRRPGVRCPSPPSPPSRRRSGRNGRRRTCRCRRAPPTRFPARWTPPEHSESQGPCCLRSRWGPWALRELADPVEVLLAERTSAVPDREHRLGIGGQHERDEPRVAETSVGKRVVRVLQQLQNAPAAVFLCDLGVEAGDGAIVSCAVLEFIEERLDLTLGLSRDELCLRPVLMLNGLCSLGLDVLFDAVALEGSASRSRTRCGGETVPGAWRLVVTGAACRSPSRGRPCETPLRRPSAPPGDARRARRQSLAVRLSVVSRAAISASAQSMSNAVRRIFSARAPRFADCRKPSTVSGTG